MQNTSNISDRFLENHSYYTTFMREFYCFMQEMFEPVKSEQYWDLLIIKATMLTKRYKNELCCHLIRAFVYSRETYYTCSSDAHRHDHYLNTSYPYSITGKHRPILTGFMKEFWEFFKESYEAEVSLDYIKEKERFFIRTFPDFAAEYIIKAYVESISETIQKASQRKSA